MKSVLAYLRRDDRQTSSRQHQLSRSVLVSRWVPATDWIAVALLDFVLRLKPYIFIRLVSRSIEAIFGVQESIGVLVGSSDLNRILNRV
jgi:hypothetical protein